MQYDVLLDRIRTEAGLSQTREARALAQAVMTALGERVTPGLAGNVASQLPQELKSSLAEAHGPRLTGGADAFVRRVQDAWQARSGERRTLPAETVQAALHVVASALTPGEVEHLLGQLPEDLDRLIRTSTLQRTTPPAR